MKKTILVTGANGLVGRNLLENKSAENFNILSPSSDELNLLDVYSIKSYFSKIQPDCVVHMAGRVGGIQANISSPVSFLYDNAIMGLQFLNECKNAGVKDVINLASSCMYPREAISPLSEDMILEGKLEPTNEGYALAKIATVKLCEYISHENITLNYKTIIPCNLYGLYDKFDAVNSHLVPAVIMKLHNAKIMQTPVVEIWGDGEARREFMYVEDLANLIWEAVERPNELPQNMNAGLGYDYSINDYYRIAAEVVNYNGDFWHNLQRPTGMKQKLIDTSKANSFGWCSTTSLKVGLGRTYDYYLNEVYRG